MNVVNINGRTYSAPDGVSVSVINNKVYFNGKLQEDLTNWKEKNIEIIVCGNCKEVKADAGNINIKGNVEGNVNADAGNISIEGDVRGNVTADCGNISANHISGNVSTDCGNIGKSSFFNKIIEKYL
jgi:hypothetical protein